MKLAVFSIPFFALIANCGRPDQSSDGSKTDLNRNLGQSSEEISSQNYVTNKDDFIAKKIGGDRIEFLVLNDKALDAKIKAGEVSASSSSTVSPEGQPENEGKGSLNIGFPTKFLGEGFVFSGTITKITDSKNENLGRLKLTNIDPINVRPFVAKDTNNNVFLVLSGCLDSCAEDSKQENLIRIPVKGISQDKKNVMLDLTALGKELDIVEILDPQGRFLPYEVLSSQTTAVDFSSSTLVFDVESKLLSRGTENSDKQSLITLTARWALKLEAGFNSAFKQRGPTAGVGYFETARNRDPLVTRFSLTEKPNGKAPIHYYIKNVPEQWQGAYAKAYEEWNDVFVGLTGSKKISYEFVSEDDAKYEQLVAGDIRFNIVEWDKDNLAPYGGLGPSHASQTTGEIYSANVLVQGPKIIKAYTKWFKVNQEASKLRQEGQLVLAAQKIAQALRELVPLKSAMTSELKVRLGKRLALNVRAQDPRLKDEVQGKGDFIPIPEGLSYENYMNGYWIDLVAHEMGHNLGLRHNFRGNLGYNEKTGRVSNSVMEYLDKSFRHKDHVGPHDAMSIAYSYTGKKPDVLNGFCTDENVATLGGGIYSPECSRDDGTDDPFGRFESEAKRIVDLLVRKKSNVAPEWEFQDLEQYLTTYVTGMLFYASGASTSPSWTNWQPKSGDKRPVAVEEIKAFVVNRVKDLQCQADVQGAAALKVDKKAKEATETNVRFLKAFMKTKAKDFKLDLAVFDCTSKT